MRVCFLKWELSTSTFLVETLQQLKDPVQRLRGMFRLVRKKKRNKISLPMYSLVCFDQLVESQQAAIPAAAVLRLEVYANFVHDGGPASGKVVLDDGSQTHGQLGAIENIWSHLLFQSISSLVLSVSA